MTFRSLVALVAALLVPTGCSDSSGPTEAEDGPHTIQVSPGDLTLFRGDTATLVARLLDRGGRRRG